MCVQVSWSWMPWFLVDFFFYTFFLIDDFLCEQGTKTMLSPEFLNWTFNDSNLKSCHFGFLINFLHLNQNNIEQSKINRSFRLISAEPLINYIFQASNNRSHQLLKTQDMDASNISTVYTFSPNFELNLEMLLRCQKWTSRVSWSCLIFFKGCLISNTWGSNVRKTSKIWGSKIAKNFWFEAYVLLANLLWFSNFLRIVFL